MNIVRSADNLPPAAHRVHRCHEMAVIRSRIWSLSAGHYRQPGTDHEKIDECAALRCAKKGRQDPGQARARQVGHSGGARARSRNGAAVCGPAFNDAPSYRVAEAPIGREVQRELLSTIVPNEIERGDAVVIAGDSFAIDDVRRIYNYRKAES